jgi:hypothetical protein
LRLKRNTLDGAKDELMAIRIELAAFRALTLLLIGMSAALLVFYSWGQDGDVFNRQAWAFGSMACVLSLACMSMTTVLLPRSGSRAADLWTGTAVALAAAVPGGILFALVASGAAKPAPLLPGLVVASLLYPQGSRRWIPLMWLVVGALYFALDYIASATLSPAAGIPEGLAVISVGARVWAVVLIEAVVVSVLSELYAFGRQRPSN